MMQPHEPLGPVWIGAREIYDRLVSLDTKVSMLVHQHDDASREIGDHESRLRSLERARWPLPTLSALVALASLVLAMFVALGGDPK